MQEESSIIEIRGTSGPRAHSINGKYLAQDPMVAARPYIYIKIDDPRICIEYSTSMEQWQIKVSMSQLFCSILHV